MPIELLSESERAKLSRFPEEIPLEDLQRHFTLSDEDIRVVERRRLDSNRLGFSLALLALRYLGFFPPYLSKAPEEGVRYVADQIDADPNLLKEYGARPKTQREHQVRAMEHLGQP